MTGAFASKKWVVNQGAEQPFAWTRFLGPSNSEVSGDPAKGHGWRTLPDRPAPVAASPAQYHESAAPTPNYRTGRNQQAAPGLNLAYYRHQL
jgi:hypothetical protein